MPSSQGPLEGAVWRHHESVLSGPAAVRARAQSSFTVAAAAATAIASVAALVDLENFPNWVWFLVLLAATLWLFVAGAFIRISTRVVPRGELEEELTADQLARRVLRDARTEERSLERSLGIAVTATYIALFATGVAGILAWIAGPETVAVEILLTSDGYAAVQIACPDLPNPLEGSTTRAALSGGEDVMVSVSGRLCNRGVTFLLRSEDIRTIVAVR